MRYTYKLAYYWEGEKISSFKNYDKVIIYSCNDEISNGYIDLKSNLYKYIRRYTRIQLGVSVFMDDNNNCYNTIVKRLKIRVLEKYDNIFTNNKYISNSLLMYITVFSDAVLINRNNNYKSNLDYKNVLDFNIATSYIRNNIANLNGNELEIAKYISKLTKEISKLMPYNDYKILYSIIKECKSNDYPTVPLNIYGCIEDGIRNYHKLLYLINDLLNNYLNCSIVNRTDSFQAFIYGVDALIDILYTTEQPIYNNEEIISKLTVHIHKNRIREILNEIDNRFDITGRKLKKIELAVICLIIKENCVLFSEMDFKTFQMLICQFYNIEPTTYKMNDCRGNTYNKILSENEMFFKQILKKNG